MSSMKAQPDNADGIMAVILFDSEKELDAWIKNKKNLEELKKLYNPRTHSCIYNKDTLQVTISKRRIT